MNRRRDPDAYDPPAPAWCPECKAMVKPKHLDFGIGPWEMGSQTGWHHDWAIGCPDCECTDLTEPPEADEESPAPQQQGQKRDGHA